MGQYFIIFNLTRRESVKPGFANWKSGCFDFQEVIQILGWSSSDEIYAAGDYGEIINYSVKDLRQFQDQDEENLDPETQHAEKDEKEFKMRYIWDGKEIQSEMSVTDYFFYMRDKVAEVKEKKANEEATETNVVEKELPTVPASWFIEKIKAKSKNPKKVTGFNCFHMHWCSTNAANSDQEALRNAWSLQDQNTWKDLAKEVNDAFF